MNRIPQLLGVLSGTLGVARMDPSGRSLRILPSSLALPKPHAPPWTTPPGMWAAVRGECCRNNHVSEKKNRPVSKKSRFFLETKAGFCCKSVSITGGGCKGNHLEVFTYRYTSTPSKIVFLWQKTMRQSLWQENCHDVFK